jgi:hypothetical protein
MGEYDFTLGIDLACSAAHVATLADAAGRLVWSNHRFRTAAVDLDRLCSKVPAGARLQLVMEPPGMRGCRWRPGSEPAAPQ